MSKGLEALKNIKREKPTFFSAIYDGDMWKEDVEAIEKGLKALEIIKKKGINIFEIRFSYSLEEYNMCKGEAGDVLTQEEYTLLKEALL